ncbi:MAG: ribosome maturation factor RimP [Desulfuromonadales bacterium]
MRQEIQAQVEELIVPILDDFGYELVDLQYKKEGSSMALCVFIDKPGGITLDDCVTVSREVGAILEIEDPIKAAYRLEVSSPGLDRPLKKPADFERFAGQKIKVKTLCMLDTDRRGHSRKTFTGELLGLEGDMIRIALDDKRGGVAMIAVADLEKANLVEDF